MVQQVTQAEYLGLTTTVEGITHHHCLNRISKVKRKLNQVNRTQQHRVPSSKKSQNLHHACTIRDEVSDSSYSMGQHVGDRLPILRN